jgi:hypothetical protein
MIDHLADLRMSEDSDITQINLPTDEQMKNALEILEASDPGNHHHKSLRDTSVERTILTILLNKDRILGYR